MSNDAATAARDYFAQPAEPGDILDPFQSFLVNSLPDNLHDACATLVTSWGDQAGGAETWRVSVLYTQGRNVWLTFRCTSGVQGVVGYYDERPGLLRVDAGKLELIPLGPDAGESNLLYHFDVADHLALGVANGLVLRVISSNDNPCCPDVDSNSEEKLVVVTDPPPGAVESLTLVTERDRHVHSDVPPLDTATTYHGTVEFEHAANGWVVGATYKFTEETLETKPEETATAPPPPKQMSGKLHFRWNAQTFKFEEEK